MHDAVKISSVLSCFFFGGEEGREEVISLSQPTVWLQATCHQGTQFNLDVLSWEKYLFIYLNNVHRTYFLSHNFDLILFILDLNGKQTPTKCMAKPSCLNN